MRNCLAFAALLGLWCAPVATRAQTQNIAVVSLQPFPECLEHFRDAGPELSSACVAVGKPQDYFWTKCPSGTMNCQKVYSRPIMTSPLPVTHASYAPTAGSGGMVRPVLRKQTRRLLNRYGCKNCRFVSVKNNPQAKEYARRMARYWGVSMPSQIAGFLVPWPFNLAASTMVCTFGSVANDAKEYREDYHQEPTSEQYSRSFGANFVGCSPIGGLVNAQNPLQFALAVFGVAGYFVAMPPAAVYAQQGLQYAIWAQNQRQAAAQSRRSHR